MQNRKRVLILFPNPHGEGLLEGILVRKENVFEFLNDGRKQISQDGRKQISDYLLVDNKEHCVA